jgi:DNA-directed RNA polymerase specialized sigma24 family protein
MLRRNRLLEKNEWNPQLSQLSTEWTLVFQAHQGSPEQVASAQVELMGRYAGAVHRYLLHALRDPDAASDLDQEFALRFLRGDFHRADPARGRFRDFVKRALHNLMIDYWRRRSTRPRSLSDHLPDPIDPTDGDRDFEGRFLSSWRAELLARAWDSLDRLEKQTGQPYHTVLRLRVEHPERRSQDLAERLSGVLGRPITPGGLRMALQRSRSRFVGFLLEEVSASLHAPTLEELEQELIDLKLLDYCRPALKRLRDPRSEHKKN